MANVCLLLKEIAEPFLELSHIGFPLTTYEISVAPFPVSPWYCQYFVFYSF
jgi:hypothetical protein